MKLAGLLRIKNESRWIRMVLDSLLGVCDHVFVLDDHSTDNTVEICQSFGSFVTGFRSSFYTLDEARDKTFLLHQAMAFNPEWALMIDGDEVLEPDAARKFIRLLDRPNFRVYTLQVIYLWNDERTMRADGVYGKFYRPSLFRVSQTADSASWRRTSTPGNLHCTSLPDGLRGETAGESGIKLLHYGYIDAQLRRAKYEWYNGVNPGNKHEDYYRHVIQGDPDGPPANAKLKHAGPLSLVPAPVATAPSLESC